MSEWYRWVRSVLSRQPETWLAYLHGQQLDHLPHLHQLKPIFRSLPLRLTVHLLFVVRHIGLIRAPNLPGKRLTYLAYSGSVNQSLSLHKVLEAVEQTGLQGVELCHERLLREGALDRTRLPLKVGPLEVLKSLFLLGSRGSALHRELRNHPPIARSYYFDVFCSVYTYLVVFERYLRECQPDIVIVSNDHNRPNRVLLALAHCRGIKTAYVQHASVSSLFPALRMNFAFLDGQSALESYDRCRLNHPDSDQQAPEAKVFLTGQMKEIKKSKPGTRLIGVALNLLDDPQEAVQLVRRLSADGHDVRIRWHPRQERLDKEFYRAAAREYPRVSLSDPEQESVSGFLSQIGYLIAANSSIHLEAALSDVAPIYYEYSATSLPSDYYGYVKNGLARKADNYREIIEMVSAESPELPEKDAIRYYSASYGTTWEGKEGELVARHIVEALESQL